MKATLLLLFGVLLVVPTFADTDPHGEDLDAILGEIREAQGVGSVEEIDPNDVSEERLERLGDAVMGEIHPDDDQHEWMDRMMGGEGSESLSAAHRWMGYRYLVGGFGMMGPGMMGGRSGWGMMGNPDFGYSDNPYLSPEEIAKRRYAAGEISRRQYRRIMEDLRAEEE